MQGIFGCQRQIRQVSLDLHPAFIPRNHRIEEAIVAGVAGNFEPFERLVTVLARPFDEQPEFASLATPPLPDERVRQTFCGT